MADLEQAVRDIVEEVLKDEDIPSKDEVESIASDVAESKIQEELKNLDLGNLVGECLDDTDLSDYVIKYLRDYDFSDAIDDAIGESNLEDTASIAMQAQFEECKDHLVNSAAQSLVTFFLSTQVPDALNRPEIQILVAKAAWKGTLRIVRTYLSECVSSVRSWFRSAPSRFLNLLGVRP